MENNESAFEAEVQDEADKIQREDEERARSISPTKKYHNVAISRDYTSENERSPLLSHRSNSDSDISPNTSPEQHHSQPWLGSAGSDLLPWYKRPSIYWLLPAFFPFCLSFGGLIVPKVNLILTLICQDYLNDRSLHDPSFTTMPAVIGAENPQCRIPEVQANVAKFQLYCNLVAGIFSALVTPHLGALSDRIGRKNVITFAACGPFISEIITIIVGNYPERFSVWWLLLGVTFDGLCGSFTASMACCYSYAADCTAPERRNVAFGYFHGTLFTGIALGPILAGYLIEWYGNIMIVFYVALGCHLFFILFLNLFIPESLSNERQQQAREKHRKAMLSPDYSTWRAALSNYNIFAPLDILWPTGEGSSSVIRRNMVFLASIDTLVFGVGMGTMNIIIIYAEYRFGWGTLQASQFLSAANISRVLALLVFLPIITRIFRGRASSRPAAHGGADMLDINIVRIAILFDLIGYAGYASAGTGAMMVVSGMVAAFGGMGSPTLQSALTKHVPPDRTGQLLGATGLLHALARVVAPTIFNSIYAATVGKFTSAVFVCLASVFVLAEVISWFLKPGLFLPADYQQPYVESADRDRRLLVHRAGSAVFTGIRRMSSFGKNGRPDRQAQTSSSSPG